MDLVLWIWCSRFGVMNLELPTATTPAPAPQILRRSTRRRAPGDEGIGVQGSGFRV